MDRKYILGIDIGTSGCKVVLVDQNGAVCGTSSAPYPLSRPQPGWTEQDPTDWWDGCVQALQAVVQLYAPSGEDIVGIGLSGQMHSLVILDDENRVIRPAILWNDQRTQQQCDELTEKVGGLEALLGETNNMMLTGYTGGKLLWLRENEPENFQRIRHILLAKDYIRWRLTGSFATDYSDASGTGLYNVRDHSWSAALLEEMELTEEVFPAVVSSTQATGILTVQAAEACGLRSGIPVFGGGGDAVLSLLGSGLTAPGGVSVTLGTSGVVAMPLEKCIDNLEGKLQVFCGASKDRWAAIGCTLSAAGSYHWFCNVFGTYEKHMETITGLDAYQELDREASEVPAGSGSLLYYPYLVGERCPIFRSDVRAAFLGADATMGKGYFARAVMEGVAFSLRQVYELMRTSGTPPAKEVVLCGGGAKSRLWRQIFADIFDMKVRISAGAAEGSAYGAALLAGVGAGLWESIEQAAETGTCIEEIQPCEEHREVYEKKYAQYCNSAACTVIKGMED